MTSDNGFGEDDGPRDRRTGRFAPGHCPNPTGRPRKARTVSATIAHALNEAIPVTENGRRRRISKLQAAAKQVANKGAAGDLRATKMAFDLAEKAEQQQAAAQPSNERLTASDEDIVGRLMGRLRQIIKEEENGPPDASRA
jgi:hypothetical protein